MNTVDQLIDHIGGSRRLFVLTGAGCSTGSGIPDYRDGSGQWKRPQPVQFQDFMSNPATRRRYWARSLIGWGWFAAARPNHAHHALSRLEAAGRLTRTVTQNVDRLHQRAGQQAVIDLHGRIDRLRCTGCGRIASRAGFQRELVERNPDFAGLQAAAAPDGDADLDGLDFGRFQVPDCRHCGGLLKPDVVFFGETVPRERTEAAYAALAGADAMLVAGSSLMVYSGYRFCRAAADSGVPIAIVNRGLTRADDLARVKVDAEVGAALEQVAAALAPHPGEPGGVTA